MKQLIGIMVIFTGISVAAFWGCRKDEPEPVKDSELISFSGLTADNDSLYIGQIARIKAVYEGKGVTFAWDASAGDILGKGDSVQYLASFCTIGQNTITCTASAENVSITRSILIHVE
ncbi:MAG TPA: hypothetical protein P5228_06630 [Bacteroidales bacterium]|nr:hypothetical protein [Bacteroidales bacterium]HRZ48201.1 hypothetical protein [Bacteroidales bacterium]